MKGYEVEILSPLNIGNGSKKMPFEYILKNGQVGLINVYKLLEDVNKINYLVDGVVNGLRSGRIDWKVLKINVENYIDYRLDYTGFSPIKGEITEFIKTAGKPYIPGSSIKGALRSSITRAMHNSISNNYISSLDFSFKNSSVKKERVDDKAEEDVFGKPHNSPFRFLNIGDTEPFKVEEMGIFEMKILNICNGKVKWYKYQDNKDNPNEAVSIYLEGLKRGSKNTGYINIDKRINDDYIIREGKIQRAEIIKNFISLVKKDVSSYIEKETRFFEKYNLPEIGNFYKKLKEINDKLKENELIIQIGFGTGFNSKTISSLFDEKNKIKLEKYYNRNFDKNLFPKTRRIIFENGKPNAVPGWVKISFK
ncbi:type III-A CRISPR-associated RAMP protein Csm5 [Thermovenabulum sp.]|uniref:type III-A CRISPR-associated RAMP protein Csm5 n=1 Tax=Thermovenabulum sp. TaxID=3100335 RepID=UPI003C7B6CB2